MDENQLHQLCKAILSGEVNPDQAVQALAQLLSLSTSGATLDVDRTRRCGFPEVIYGEGKSVEVLTEIVERMHAEHLPVLATRVSVEKSRPLLEAFPAGVYNDLARTFSLPAGNGAQQLSIGHVAVVTAGTSDIYVAEEAVETLRWMNTKVTLIRDVGVAGPHRLPVHLPVLQAVDAVVVVAGMEGALPSFVGGFVACPVIGVPTSVGYGSSLGGITALLGMLNSCSANVTVVNIDAGFKGGYVAGLVAHTKQRVGTTPD